MWGHASTVLARCRVAACRALHVDQQLHDGLLGVECLRLLDQYFAPVLERLCPLTGIHGDVRRGPEPAATVCKRTDRREQMHCGVQLPVPGVRVGRKQLELVIVRSLLQRFLQHRKRLFRAIEFIQRPEERHDRLAGSQAETLNTAAQKCQHLVGGLEIPRRGKVCLGVPLVLVSEARGHTIQGQRCPRSDVVATTRRPTSSTSRVNQGRNARRAA